MPLKEIKLHEYRGHLFQHFDSRGGTIAVIGKLSVWDAATLVFVEALNWDESDVDEVDRGSLREQDYVGEFVLFSPVELVDCEYGIDLEGDGDGRVLQLGNTKTLGRDGANDYDICEVLHLLEYVPKGMFSVFYNTVHPDWNDDAFGFFVVFAHKEVK